MWKKKIVMLGIILSFLVVALPYVSAELFNPVNERSISTGQNADWYYIKVQKIGQTDYLGLSKANEGYIGIAVDSQYIGYMFFVPAFKHPVNGYWYLCPIIDTGSYSVSTGSNYIDVSGSGSYTCYRYDNPSLTGTGNVTVNKFRLLVNPDASVKITANMTVTGLNPTDTGFAYIFVPSDQTKFRYAKVGSTLEDLAGVDRSLTIDKLVEFYNQNSGWIGHRFDWGDMPAGTNYIMKIVTLGTKKGLLVGSYGYGAGSNIYVDPLYDVDYSPIPAEHLLYGNVSVWNDSQFTIVDITTGVSDGYDNTTYEVRNLTKHNVTGAWDDFNCVTAGTCGVGWTSNWTVVSGDCRFQDTTNSPHSLPYHLMSGGAGCQTYRNLSTIYPPESCYISFWAKASLLGVSDNCQYKYYNGSSFTTLLQLVDGQDDNTYRFYSYEVCNTYGMSASSSFFFSANPDKCFLDDINYTKTEYNYTNGFGITGRWSQVYDSFYQWWIRIKKTSTGSDSVRVYAYSANNTISQTNYVDAILSGTGFFNVNVSSLMNYEKNVAGLNYTQLRFYTSGSNFFSEVQLRKEYNDTTPPRIQNCQVNDTTLLGNEYARFKCNVTDDLDVQNVNGTIGGIVHNFTKDGDWYYYDWKCLSTGSVSWTLAQASDIVGNYNSTNPALSVSCKFRPNITIDSPVNGFMYGSSNVGLNVSVDESVNTWWYVLDGGSPVYFTPNITITYVEGQHTIVVYANDSVNNIGNASVTFIMNAYVPVVTIHSPQNLTYNDSVELNVSASESIISWWVSVNDGVNLYFTTNMTTNLTEVMLDITTGLVNGTNHIHVSAEDVGNSIGSGTVYFTMLISAENISASLYYPSFATVGENVTIYVIVRDSGVLYPNATVHIDIDNVSAYMTWNETTSSYNVIWIPATNGVYPFVVHVIGSGSVMEIGNITISDRYHICVRIWNNMSMSPEYLYRNEFAWLYLIKTPDPTLTSLFGRDKFACPPQGSSECHWHSEYTNGTACMELYEAGNYSLYIIGNNINFNQDIGSGYLQECEFCAPVKVQQRLLLNLGSYVFDGNSDEFLDLYVNPIDLSLTGVFFGFSFSWVWAVVFFAIGLVAFGFTLWATRSLKSAIAMLLIFPTIIYILMNYALW